MLCESTKIQRGTDEKKIIMEKSHTQGHERDRNVIRDGPNVN